MHSINAKSPTINKSKTNKSRANKNLRAVHKSHAKPIRTAVKPTLYQSNSNGSSLLPHMHRISSHSTLDFNLNSFSTTASPNPKSTRKTTSPHPLHTSSLKSVHFAPRSASTSFHIHSVSSHSFSSKKKSKQPVFELRQHNTTESPTLTTTKQQPTQEPTKESAGSKFVSKLPKGFGSIFKQYGALAVVSFASVYFTSAIACVAIVNFVPSFDAQNLVDYVSEEPLVKPMFETGKETITKLLTYSPSLETFVHENPKTALNIASGLLVNELIAPLRALAAIAITKKIGDRRNAAQDQV